MFQTVKTQNSFHNLHILGVGRVCSSIKISPGPGGTGKHEETGVRIPTPGRDPNPSK